MMESRFSNILACPSIFLSSDPATVNILGVVPNGMASYRGKSSDVIMPCVWDHLQRVLVLVMC